MASGGSYDRRYSSIAGEIDGAIERVVAHFEENDLALRLDVLRGLAVQAKLAMETERMKERLRQHPATRELIERVTTRSRVYARLHTSLTVEEFACDYDRRRNVDIHATVRWELPEASKKDKQPATTMAKKQKTNAKRRRPLYTRYAFSRQQHEAGEDGEAEETIVSFGVTVAVGAEAAPRELVRFEMASDTPYPRSFYEEDHSGDMEDEEVIEEDASDDGAEEEEPAPEEEPSSETDNHGECGSDCASHDDGDEKSPFGEQIRAFEFDDTVLDAIAEWVGPEAEQLDPSDLVSFFLALPVCEDDWQMDERVCEILFSAGGDSMMEEEIVDSDDEENDAEGQEDEEDEEEGAQDDDDDDVDRDETKICSADLD